MRARRALLALLALAAAAPLPALALDIPLTVQEELPDQVAGLARTAAPVSVGVPLDSLSGITSVSQLGLAGVTAGQFRELARWPNGNLKWVLVDFDADVPAGGVNTTISVVNGGGNFGGASLATDNGGSISVATGTANFTVQKSPFRFFDGVSVGGTTLVSAGGEGLVVIDPSGNRYTSANDGTAAVSIEENGPVRAVVLASGSLRNGAGTRICDYRVRLHFYRGESYVRAWVSLRNAQAAYPTTFRFHSAEVAVPLSIGSGLRFTTASSLGTASDQLAAADTMYLFQAYSTQNGWNENNYALAPMVQSGGTFSQNGVEIRKVGGTVYRALTGNAADYAKGWAALENGAGQGLTVGLRWMAAWWPSGFQLSGDGVARVELFSKRNSLSSIAFAWGAYETRELLFDFHTAAPGNRDQTLYDMQYPLVARAQLTQYSAAGAIFGETKLVSASDQQAWFAQHGASSPSLANITPSFWRYHAWSTGGGGNQTDFALLDLIDFLRTGNGGFLAEGERNSQYKADTPVRHSDGFDWTQNQIDAGDEGSGTNLGTFNGRIFDFSHAHWSSMPIAYYLTGNELFHEAVIDFGEWKHGMGDGSAPNYYAPLSILGDGDMRIWSRYYRDFALLWDVTRDPRYWNDLSTMTTLLLTSQDVPGSALPAGRNYDRGYVWLSHGGYVLPRSVSDFMTVQIHFEAAWEVFRLMREAHDSRVPAMEDYLFGLADFIYNEWFYDFGTTVGQYGYLYSYHLDEVNNTTTNPYYPPNGGNVFRPISSSRPLTFAFLETGNTKYLDREARLLLGDIQYVTNRTPTDYSSEAFMETDLYRPVTGWYNVPGVTVTSLGGGSYQLSWTVPAGTTAYRIKYSDRTIVDWLGFDPATRAYAYPPASNVAWFAAATSPNPPAPLAPGSVQSVTLSGLDPTKAFHFAVRYTTTIADTTPPSAVRDMIAK